MIFEKIHRGELFMLRIGFDNDKYLHLQSKHIKERIAQFVLRRYEDVCFNVVEELSETERGTGGFGSTGK